MPTEADIVFRIRQLCYDIENGLYGEVGDRALPIALDILIILGEDVTMWHKFSRRNHP